MTPAQTVKKAREHLGLTQAEFGQLTGHEQATICRWEQGAWTPSFWDLALAEALLKSNPGKRLRRVLAARGPIYTLGRVLVSC